MTDRAAGLKDFNEAFAEALAEEEAAASSTTPSAEGELEVLNAGEDVEQPAVETEEEAGVFTGLESEDTESEQSDIRNSQHQVKVNGEILEVSYDELVNGYQRHADYTRGKQELARKEEEYDKAITLWDALESDYVGTVQKLMSRAGVRGQVSAPKPVEKDIDALVEAKLQEKLAADPRLQQFEQEQSLRQLNVMFDQIEEDFNLPPLTNQDKQLILTKAQEWNTTDLQYVTWRLLQVKQQRDAERENAELTSTVKGRRSGDHEDYETQPEYYSTVRAAWEAALAEEGDLQ